MRVVLPASGWEMMARVRRMEEGWDTAAGGEGNTGGGRCQDRSRAGAGGVMPRQLSARSHQQGRGGGG